jgi:hypothetical protein
MVCVGLAAMVAVDWFLGTEDRRRKTEKNQECYLFSFNCRNQINGTKAGLMMNKIIKMGNDVDMLSF